MSVPHPSGEQFTIAADGWMAVIVGNGGGLRTLSHGDIDVVDGYGLDDVCGAGHGQLLIPWPNRIRDGRYQVADEQLQLDLSEPARGNAIHGLVRWAPWVCVDHHHDRVVMRHRLGARHGYPFSLEITADYSVGEEGFTCRFGARNVGAAAAPYGAGAHPYLRLAAGPLLDECTLQIPSRRELLIDDRLIPIATQSVLGGERDFVAPRIIGATSFDTCFVELDRDAKGLAWTRLSDDSGASVSLWQDSALDYLMLFSGDGFPPAQRRRALAMEPMTCAPNAFQSGDGLVWLNPGDEHSCRFGITVAPTRG